MKLNQLYKDILEISKSKDLKVSKIGLVFILTKHFLKDIRYKIHIVFPLSIINLQRKLHIPFIVKSIYPYGIWFEKLSNEDSIVMMFRKSKIDGSKLSVTHKYTYGSYKSFKELRQYYKNEYLEDLKCDVDE